MTTTTRRTRLGKVVGSITTDPSGWTYWAESNNGHPGFVTVAPSGARWTWFVDEADAIACVADRNAEWFAV